METAETLSLSQYCIQLSVSFHLSCNNFVKIAEIIAKNADICACAFSCPINTKKKKEEEEKKKKKRVEVEEEEEEEEEGRGLPVEEWMEVTRRMREDGVQEAQEGAKKGESSKLGG